MGLFRKMTSMTTLGAVDFRSDKERTAMYTRQTRNAIRSQAGRPRLASQLAEAQANLARVRTLKDLTARMRSADPAVRAAALAEWQNSKP